MLACILDVPVCAVCRAEDRPAPGRMVCRYCQEAGRLITSMMDAQRRTTLELAWARSPGSRMDHRPTDLFHAPVTHHFDTLLAGAACRVVVVRICKLHTSVICKKMVSRCCITITPPESMALRGNTASLQYIHLLRPVSEAGGNSLLATLQQDPGGQESHLRSARFCMAPMIESRMQDQQKDAHGVLTAFTFATPTIISACTHRDLDA